MSRRVVVTGAGVLSPLGDTPAELHAALVAGRSALGPLSAGDGLELPQTLGAALQFTPQQVLGRERNLRPLDRVSQMAAACAQRALDAAGLAGAERRHLTIGLVLGTMFCGLRTIAEFDRRGLTRGPAYVSPFDFANTVINAAAGQTAIWHDLRGINSTVSAGPSSGLQAVAYAADQIRWGRAEVLLAGGVEELCPESLAGFARAGLLCPAAGRPVPFDARRDGLALGEGAALLVLEEAEAARARGARVLAELCGAASSFDPTRGQEAASLAAAVARAARAALDEAGVPPEQLGALSAGANGGRVWDHAEAAGLAEALGPRAGGVAVCAIKALLGEALGAAGALQVVDVVEMLRDGWLPGVAGLEAAESGLGLDPRCDAQSVACSHALISAAGFDGACAALVVGRAAA